MPGVRMVIRQISIPETQVWIPPRITYHVWQVDKYALHENGSQGILYYTLRTYKIDLICGMLF